MKDALTWFEIPVERIGRAQQIREEVLQVKQRSNEAGEPMEMFPAAEESGAELWSGGALVERPGLGAAGWRKAGVPAAGWQHGRGDGACGAGGRIDCDTGCTRWR